MEAIPRVDRVRRRVVHGMIIAVSGFSSNNPSLLAKVRWRRGFGKCHDVVKSKFLGPLGWHDGRQKHVGLPRAWPFSAPWKPHAAHNIMSCTYLDNNKMQNELSMLFFNFLFGNDYLKIMIPSFAPGYAHPNSIPTLPGIVSYSL